MSGVVYSGEFARTCDSSPGSSSLLLQRVHYSSSFLLSKEIMHQQGCACAHLSASVESSRIFEFHFCDELSIFAKSKLRRIFYTWEFRILNPYFDKKNHNSILEFLEVFSRFYHGGKNLSLLYSFDD